MRNKRVWSTLGILALTISYGIAGAEGADLTIEEKAETGEHDKAGTETSDATGSVAGAKPDHDKSQGARKQTAPDQEQSIDKTPGVGVAGKIEDNQDTNPADNTSNATSQANTDTTSIEEQGIDKTPGVGIAGKIEDKQDTNPASNISSATSQNNTNTTSTAAETGDAWTIWDSVAIMCLFISPALLALPKPSLLITAGIIGDMVSIKIRTDLVMNFLMKGPVMVVLVGSFLCGSSWHNLQSCVIVIVITQKTVGLALLINYGGMSGFNGIFRRTVKAEQGNKLTSLQRLAPVVDVFYSLVLRFFTGVYDDCAKLTDANCMLLYPNFSFLDRRKDIGFGAVVAGLAFTLYFVEYASVLNFTRAIASQSIRGGKFQPVAITRTENGGISTYMDIIGWTTHTSVVVRRKLLQGNMTLIEIANVFLIGLKSYQHKDKASTKAAKNDMMACLKRIRGAPETQQGLNHVQGACVEFAIIDMIQSSRLSPAIMSLAWSNDVFDVVAQLVADVYFRGHRNVNIESQIRKNPIEKLGAAWVAIMDTSFPKCCSSDGGKWNSLGDRTWFSDPFYHHVAKVFKGNQSMARNVHAIFPRMIKSTPAEVLTSKCLSAGFPCIQEGGGVIHPIDCRTFVGGVFRATTQAEIDSSWVGVWNTESGKRADKGDDPGASQTWSNISAQSQFQDWGVTDNDSYYAWINAEHSMRTGPARVATPQDESPVEGSVYAFVHEVRRNMMIKATGFDWSYFDHGGIDQDKYLLITSDLKIANVCAWAA